MNDTQIIEMTSVSAPPPPPLFSTSPTLSPIQNKVLERGEIYNGITLEAIGLTLVGGICIWIVTVLAFGISVMYKSNNIAPRCTARHGNTIYRSRKDIILDNKRRMKCNNNNSDGDVEGYTSQDPSNNLQNNIETSDSTNASNYNNNNYYKHVQDRGNPFLGWIPWTLHLSYDRMIRGVPGTGTRDEGMSGQLLGVNLDAIVLFRYNALCLRVTALVCFICIVVILPINWTASCLTVDTLDSTSCSDFTRLTNYGRTTIANIIFNGDNNPNIETPNALLRLYVIAFCTWYITYFVLRNIERDWKENLVLRRVYYLESDHYGSRQVELAKTLYKGREGEEAPGSGGGIGTPKNMEEVNNINTRKHRNPWIPNPEQRDTVPSIELYSVLVGGLPSLPDEVLNSKVDMETALGFSNRVNIDWQLAVATTFFDHCVPNQPGFSSSIVAVTILPGAPELAKAWRKWYAAAAALRRLRFIRSVINEKRYYSIDDLEEEGGECYDQSEEEYYEGYDGAAEQTPSSSSKRISFANHDENGYATNNAAEVPAPTAGLETSDIDHQIFKSLNYGPEQQAVYSREMAQGAAACCPNGCCEGRVRRQPIDKLLQMEEATVIRLENAQYELKCAQMKAAVSTVDGGDKINGTTSADGLDDIEDNILREEQTMNGLKSLSVEVDSPTNGMMPHQDVPTSTRSSTSHRSSTSPTARSAVLRMNAEGRFLFNNSNSAISEDVELSDVNRSSPMAAESSLRRRTNTIQSLISDGDGSKSSNQWDQVKSILRKNTEYDESRVGSPRNNQEIETGIWYKPSIKAMMRAVKSDILSTLKAIFTWTKGTTEKATSTLARDSTYAVVTFSSRQAAVAARHCLADGRGVQKWLSLETLPVAPLADAAPCDIITCRGCCRPVTLNLNQNQLMIRRYIALSSLAFIYIFYTIPITLAQTLVSPQKLQESVPAFYDWLNSTGFSASILSGLVSALLYTLFFALCPIMFKGIANSGSRATSVQEAERYALKYYWYFMLVTAFAFTGLADAAISIWDHSNAENTINSVEILLESIARQTPLTTAATWLNWIIVRTTMTLPLQYLLQVNTFLFGCIGWKCCARCVMGGGPGGPIPYRVYIDGGTVFLCVVALAPQSPLVAPVALLYYLFCAPLWRRNCIFMYRPKFDTGGERWPFLSDILITSVFVGQFLLTLQMVLKDAFGPAIVAGIPAIPTYLYRKHLLKTFKRAYADAGLLQTSLLDGWDNTIPTTIEAREEFRRFLVDAHKAAYIPVCIAGGATNILTAEPAVAIPSDNDDMLGYGELSKAETPMSCYPPNVDGTVEISSQRGASITPSSTRAERGFAWQGESATTDPNDPGCTQS